MNSLRKSVLGVAVALVMGGAQAGTLLNIDPDGSSGGAGAIIDVASLEWSAGNLLRTPGSVASGSATNLAVGDVLQTYLHARLGNFRTGLGSLHSTTGFEWTFVGAYQERVEAIVPGFGSVNTYTSTQTTGTNFFQIWYDPTPDSNDLLGKGFKNDAGDATLVMSGNILPWSGTVGDPGVTNFNKAPNTNVTLDQFGGFDDYAGQKTVSGFGATDNIVIKADYYNNAFFPGLGPQAMLALHMQSQLSLPFNHVDPSSCFWNGSAYIGGAGGGFVDGCPNTIGVRNGKSTSGPNEVIQSYARTGFNVPEPSSVALLGLGLAGLGLNLRRRRRVGLA